MKKITKTEYERYLNDVVTEIPESMKMMKGKKTRSKKYGTLLRRYDKITFENEFNKWRKK